MESKNDLLKPSDVALRFGVDPKTVVRWAKAGKIQCVRLPSGHRRYRKEDVDKFFEETQ